MLSLLAQASVSAAVVDIIKSPAGLLVLGVIGLCACALPVLWTIHLIKETFFGKGPSLEELLSAKASKAELDEACSAIRAETQAEFSRLREANASQHSENRERLRRLEDQSSTNGTNITRLDTKVDALVTSDHLMGTKIDRLIERLSGNAKPA